MLVKGRNLKNRIIIALDVDNLQDAKRLVEQLRDYAGVFKVGKQLYTNTGPEVLEIIHKNEGEVFLDLKFHDIPNTVAKAGQEAVKLKVFMYNLHALGGFDMMRMAVDFTKAKAMELNIPKPIVLAVTLLTSLNEKDLREVGIDYSVDEEVLRLAKLSKKAGVDGVVASPREVRIIRENLNEDFLIVTPGIRPNPEIIDDQKRIMTPKEAILAGSDFIVIGRPIIEAADPVESAKGILEDIKLLSM
ncbi:MAG: orotidine-5'-phosphate decarboxylase [Thermodesulfobacteriota bacterium]